MLTGGGLLLGVCVAAALAAASPGVLSLIGASDAIRELIRPYWAIQVLAMWVGGVLYFGYSLFRAHGKHTLSGADDGAHQPA